MTKNFIENILYIIATFKIYVNYNKYDWNINYENMK